MLNEGGLIKDAQISAAFCDVITVVFFSIVFPVVASHK